MLDTDDTIAAIGTAVGGSLRGMVRLSGPRVLDCLSACFRSADSSLPPLAKLRTPQVITGYVTIAEDDSVELPCDLFLWPGQRSYTCQPTAELHTLGSQPLLERLLRKVCEGDARLAEPGEFTLRAFLAGRLDLTQAEAVLGVIDASSSTDLTAALVQLAGGLSQPLAELREQLLRLLAELEAGLDFAEEDIEFISADQLRRQLLSAQAIVSEVAGQLSSREDASQLPRVVLSGPPNVGKSSLFNALVQKYGVTQPQSLVSNQSGTTRDFVTATLVLQGLTCQLIDTAGVEAIGETDSIEKIAQERTLQQHEQADLIVRCEDTNARIADRQNGGLAGECGAESLGNNQARIVVKTKCDLLAAQPATSISEVACSSMSGEGLGRLAQVIYEKLANTPHSSNSTQRLTATRCSASLRLAQESLTRAVEILAMHGGEELIAAELRGTLHALGKVVGVVYTDDILDRIFAQFCIGK